MNTILNKENRIKLIVNKNKPTKKYGNFPYLPCSHAITMRIENSLSSNRIIELPHNRIQLFNLRIYHYKLTYETIKFDKNKRKIL